MGYNLYKVCVRRTDGSTYYYNEYAFTAFDARCAAVTRTKSGKVISVTRVYEGGKVYA